jgi:hypothetical protein
VREREQQVRNGPHRRGASKKAGAAEREKSNKYVYVWLFRTCIEG